MESKMFILQKRVDIDKGYVYNEKTTLSSNQNNATKFKRRGMAIRRMDLLNNIFGYKFLKIKEITCS